MIFRPSSARNKKSQRVPLSEGSPESQELRDAEAQTLCYKEGSVAENSLVIARKIQSAFTESYLSKVNKVRITKENLAENLLSVVSFKTAD